MRNTLFRKGHLRLLYVKNVVNMICFVPLFPLIIVILFFKALWASKFTFCNLGKIMTEFF